ncbi:hypothetical protein FAZ79_02330 [Guyparkeria sp. SB14A]|uniref:hypothetical protein n=1 Tax=Guyparkeria sp. SB14A TaxID=2571147 RepID=UPI0010ABE26A|nr:hypothetical protein [Guyparkeria sp. SB14A]TKA91117.1 hypothetical protein FAZ79_02330 [Guyparkeria sp. SB14A]
MADTAPTPTLGDPLDAALPAWRRAGHRLPVILSGSPAWALAQGHSLTRDNTLWIGPDAPAGSMRCRSAAPPPRWAGKATG